MSGVLGWSVSQALSRAAQACAWILVMAWLAHGLWVAFRDSRKGEAARATGGRWLAFLATLAALVAFALPLLTLAELRSEARARYFVVIGATLAAERDVLIKLGERLPLLGAWALALGSAFLLPRGPSLRWWVRVGVIVAVALSCLAASCWAREALLTFAALRIEDIGKGAIWTQHFDASRGALKTAFFALGACFGLGGTLCVLARHAQKPARPLSRSKLWAQRGALLASLAASVMLWRATQPLVAEAAVPLSINHQFANCSLCIWEPPLNIGSGPDSVVDAPLVRVRGGAVKINGTAAISLSELTQSLRDLRDLSRYVHSNAGFASVLLDVAPSEPVENVERALAAIHAAGIHEARLLLTERLELERPALGKLVGYRSSSLRLELRLARAECEAPHIVAVSNERSQSFKNRLTEWLHVRKQGALCKAVLDPRVLPNEPSILVRHLRINSVDFDALVTRRGIPAIEVRYLARNGQRLATLDALEAEVASEGRTLLLGMNAGMFSPTHAPVGLLVTNGREQAPIDLADGEGNFYLKPNGVFVVLRNGDVRIVSSENYQHLPRADVQFATQSGPLLLSAGNPHPAVRPDSNNRHIRNAVGVSPVGAVFIISRAPVTYYELILAFRELGCDDALYLDGFVSKMYSPPLERFDRGGDFGPLIAVVRAP
ncbi:MAG: phosphodiester glycosidase family protein [Myxococcota bacterium]